MNVSPWLLAAALLVPSAGPDDLESRKPNQLAPSLPLLTDAEEEQLDRIVDRFIQFDIGALPGKDGRKALTEFHGLGPEATFALLRGLGKAAAIEASCPAVTIGRKLLTVIRTTHDVDLLEFIRENAGVDVGRSRHLGLIKELQREALDRRQALLRSKRQGPPDRVVLRPIETPALPPERLERDPEKREDRFVIIKPRGDGEKKPVPLRSAELARLLATETGPRLLELLTELERRPSAEALGPLAQAAGEDRSSADRYAALDLLGKHLARQPGDSVKACLKDERAPVRLAAAKVAGDRRLRFGEELIALLTDPSAEVRIAAHEALALVSGIDHGPVPTATEAERAESVRLWRAWWAKQGGK